MKSKTPPGYKYYVRLAKTRKGTFEAVLKFKKPVKDDKLTLKTGVYVFGGEAPKPEDILVWNPKHEPMLPVFGIALAMGKSTSMRNKIVMFKPRTKKYYLLDLTSHRCCSQKGRDPRDEHNRWKVAQHWVDVLNVFHPVDVIEKGVSVSGGLGLVTAGLECELRDKLDKGWRDLERGVRHAGKKSGKDLIQDLKQRLTKKSPEATLHGIAKNIEVILSRIIPNHNLVQDLMGYVTMARPIKKYPEFSFHFMPKDLM